MKNNHIHTRGRRILSLLLAAALSVCVGASAAAEVSAHVHAKAEQPQIENIVPPTCASEGSYEEVFLCRYCGEVMERNTVTVAKTNQHQPGEPVVENKKDADGCADPVVRYDSVVYCEVCGKELSRTRKEYGVSYFHIPDYSLKRTVRSDPEGGVLVTFDDPAVPPLHKDGHLPEGYENAVIEAGRYLLNDGRNRTCADGETRCAYCGELLERALPHVWGKGKYRADETNPLNVFTDHSCLFCGEKKTVQIIVDYLRGDIDGDGCVTPEDARLVLRAAVGLEQLGPEPHALRMADYDGDGRITPADARIILRISVGLPA